MAFVHTILAQRIFARLCQRRGFSLMEMALVLVIVGILLSLGMKGYHVVEEARLRAVAAQIQTLQSAVMMYHDRFHALPGDGPAPMAGLGSGNSNGQIEADGGSEASLFWQHLAAAGLLASPSPPVARVGGEWTVGMSSASYAFGNWLILGKKEGGLPPSAALNLDQQLDDGAPETGMIRADGEGCLNDHRYNLGRKDKVCRLLVEL